MPITWSHIFTEYRPIAIGGRSIGASLHLSSVTKTKKENLNLHVFTINNLYLNWKHVGENKKLKLMYKSVCGLYVVSSLPRHVVIYLRRCMSAPVASATPWSRSTDQFSCTYQIDAEIIVTFPMWMCFSLHSTHVCMHADNLTNTHTDIDILHTLSHIYPFQPVSVTIQYCRLYILGVSPAPGLPCQQRLHLPCYMYNGNKNMAFI